MFELQLNVKVNTATYDDKDHVVINAGTNPQTTTAVGDYGEVYASGHLIGNDSDNLLKSLGDSTIEGGAGRDMLQGDGNGSHELHGANDTLWQRSA